MNGIDIIILIVFTIILSAGIGYYLTKDQPTLEEMTEQDDQEQLSQDLYNKDLRPIVAKKEPVRSLTESAKELVKEIEKVSKVPTTQKESQQLAKDLVEIATATPKKKRKYYPKKKKA